MILLCIVFLAVMAFSGTLLLISLFFVVVKAFKLGSCVSQVVPGGLRWHSGLVLPKLGDAAKEEGKPVDANYDSSDDEDELAGVVSHCTAITCAALAAITASHELALHARESNHCMRASDSTAIWWNAWSSLHTEVQVFFQTLPLSGPLLCLYS